MPRLLASVPPTAPGEDAKQPPLLQTLLPGVHASTLSQQLPSAPCALLAACLQTWPQPDTFLLQCKDHTASSCFVQCATGPRFWHTREAAAVAVAHMMRTSAQMAPSWAALPLLQLCSAHPQALWPAR